MRLALACPLALVALAAAATPATQRPTAQDLTARVQARYRAVRDFRADFSQTTRSSLLPQTRVDSGSVKVQKPGLMRWEYTDPEEQIFGSDGKEFYLYVAADRVVTYTPVPEPGDENTALLFLAGRGDLVSDFTSYLPAEQPSDAEWHLSLAPRQKEADYEYIILMVDRRSLRFTGLETVEADGARSTIRLSNYRENVGLKASEFAFTPPRGTEIIRR
jgi:outer membrane lipoprotein carrier protein